MFFVLLITFLVCGENQESSSVVEPQKKHSQMQHQHQTTAQPFDVYMSQMRRVPNTSDPLHNRWVVHGLSIYKVSQSWSMCGLWLREVL